MMNRFFVIFAIIIELAVTSLPVSAQDTIRISLPETIARARVRSVNAAVALNELKTAYWEFRTYRAERLPEVNFSATAPAYRKQYSTFMNSDGNYSFVANDYMEINGSVSVDQNIILTGGKLSLATQLDFLREFSGEPYNRYMALPVALTLEQPVFGVNTLKWNSRIEPVKYEEAKAKFLSATEEVAMTAINHYFNLLMAKENVGIAMQNLDNAVRLHQVAREKRAMGQISNNDLLQMELNELNARSALTTALSNYKSYMFTLRAFLDYDEDIVLEPVLPDNLPNLEISYQDALDRALKNNKFSRNIRRRQLEAEYEVAKAKGDLRQINLYAQIGYSGTDRDLNTAYSRLRSSQIVEVGVKIPILDWGRRQGKVKVAKSNREVVESRLRQESQTFSQDIFILVERFSNQRMLLENAVRADEIARRRYDTNVETFLIGKISTLDLNDSQVKKDESRQDYINELYTYWHYFYQLRSLTLYDYVNKSDIDADFRRIVN